MTTYSLVDVVPDSIGDGVECPVFHEFIDAGSNLEHRDIHLKAESTGENNTEENVVPSDEEAARVYG
ncbi:hypothetical protein BP6252_02710 [Coleophoma cylindrospora]|uniref:Uncharacterized protein n=1 Tax=Coleophoma cylindrospora TaxID=1849047 RepID=A0A3D8SFJ2_9HELO|nr:hypothetical protein BP6252_02710 [Coleophoma cylindrospora]